MRVSDMVLTMRKVAIDAYIEICQILPLGMAKKIEVFIFRKLLGKNDYIHTYYLSKKRSKKKYCIYRYTLPQINLMATAINYIFQYDFTIQKGFIPIIDLEPGKVFEEGRLNEMNMWEKIFVQAMPLEDVIKQDYVIVDMPGNLMYSRKTAKAINGDRKKDRIYTQQDNWRTYYGNIYTHIRYAWKLKPEVEKYCNEKYNQLFPEGNKILGVMLREEFSKEYNQMLEGKEAELYSNHPLGPDISEIIEEIKKLRKKWEFDKIFIATMYKESYEKLKLAFGEDAVLLERKRRTIDYKKDECRRRADATSNENYELYKSNTDYFVRQTMSYICELIILSKCDYFVGVHCSGSASALAFNGGKYRDIHIFPDYRGISNY